jgi:hypothetical protein
MYTTVPPPPRPALTKNKLCTLLPLVCHHCWWFTTIKLRYIATLTSCRWKSEHQVPYRDFDLPPAFIKCHKLHWTNSDSVLGFACVCSKHFGHNVMEIRECCIVDGSDTPQRFVRRTFWHSLTYRKLVWTAIASVNSLQKRTHTRTHARIRLHLWGCQGPWEMQMCRHIGGHSCSSDFEWLSKTVCSYEAFIPRY